MKSVKILLALVIFVSAGLSGMAQQGTEAANKSETGIQVYYSHFNKRCATCNAVENETLSILKEKYGKQMENGQISFTALNLDEKADKKTAKKLKISGQTLLLVGKSEKINLTNEGFMNARTNPEKFQEVLISNLNKLL